MLPETIHIDAEPLILGTTEEGDEIAIPIDEFLRVNLDVMGAFGTGKSWFIEYLVRTLMIHGFGCAFFSWHRENWRNILAWAAWYDYNPGIIPISLSRPTIGLALFKLSGDAHAQAERILGALETTLTLEKSAGILFRRYGGLFLRYVLLSGKLPHECMGLLDHRGGKARGLVARELEQLGRPDDARQWLDLSTEKAHDFSLLLQSTKTRFENLIAGAAYKFLCGTLTVREILNQGLFLLVDLQPSDQASPQSCKDFAGLLYSEMFFQAMNKDDDTPYKLFADECTNYVPVVAAEMLDQLRKFGLFQAFIHHRPYQGTFENPQLQAAVDQQTRLKIVFGGVPIKPAYEVAQTLFMSEINSLMVKQEKTRLLTRWEEEESETITEAEDRTSISTGKRYAPRQEEEVDLLYYTRDEKIHIFVEDLARLPQQHCFVQYAGGTTFEVETPFVVQPDILPEEVDAFIMKLVEPFISAPKQTPQHDEDEDFVE